MYSSEPQEELPVMSRTQLRTGLSSEGSLFLVPSVVEVDEE